MRRVALHARTSTLLLLVVPSHTDDNLHGKLVSMRRKTRNENHWVKRQSFDIRLLGPGGFYSYVAVCASHVLIFGVLHEVDEPGTQEYMLYVFEVSAKGTLRDAGSVKTRRHIKGLACTRRGNDTLVAIAHGSSVSLQRLVSLRLEQIASVNLIDPYWLIFRGELLLVADMDVNIEKHAIISFRAMGNGLTEQQVLLEARSSVCVREWSLAGD